MNSTSKSSSFEPEMLALFRYEINIQIAHFDHALKELKLGTHSKESLEALIHSIALIKSSVCLMHLISIIDLTKALEALFYHMQKEPETQWPSYLTLIERSMEPIRGLVKGDEAVLLAKTMNRDVEADKSILEINQILSGEKKSAPQMEIPKEENDLKDDHWIADPILINLFKTELENQVNVLSNGLISLEQNEQPAENLDSMLRAVHSIKGASRVVELAEITQFAHVIEDVLVAVKNEHLELNAVNIDVLLKAADFLGELSHLSPGMISPWLLQKHEALKDLKEQLFSLSSELAQQAPHSKPELLEPVSNDITRIAIESLVEEQDLKQDRILRVTAQNLNQLMGLAGESMVESRWLFPFSQSLMSLKKNINEFVHYIDMIKANLQNKQACEEFDASIKNLMKKGKECQQILNVRISDLDLFINRNSSLSDRLYREVVDSRMRSFADGVEAFPRMVRDLARQLHKKVHFEIHGKATSVDRDILEKLEAPLAHLLRNAVDHGIETPEERLAAGKPVEGTIRLDAQHRAGMLSITVSDDGRGVDIEKIRKKVIERGLANPELAAKLTENELIDFLFLQGFTTAAKVTEISGRGVGLNVVQNMIQEVAGNINASSVPGRGMSFNLQMPLTLSVIRALLIEISREPYAIALSRIDRAVFIPQENVHMVENKQYFRFEGKNIGLISASQILGFEEIQHSSLQIPVVIVNDRINSYGIVVDSFLGEKELVVQELDPRLGKVPDINAGAFMEDGSPILILDVEDMVRSIDTILTVGSLSNFSYSRTQEASKKLKRILVVDDSITVREVECRLLRNQGYEVETAINGMEGWNALRIGDFDLVVTDVDMPRMNGIELVRAIKSDARLRSIPVMIVSYKERDEDRLKGLEAGANYYLTKSSFHDQALINAVIDLIGEA